MRTLCVAAATSGVMHAPGLQPATTPWVGLLFCCRSLVQACILGCS